MGKSVEVYGIKNCSTVVKSLNWLKSNEISVNFHDFKKEVLTAELVNQWFDQVAIEKLINKRGTTWRKLSDAQKALNNRADLIQLIIDNPSIVKRPVVGYQNQWHVAFDAEEWSERFLA